MAKANANAKGNERAGEGSVIDRSDRMSLTFFAESLPAGEQRLGIAFQSTLHSEAEKLTPRPRADWLKLFERFRSKPSRVSWQDWRKGY